jgi:prevent-host-death family protein
MKIAAGQFKARCLKLMDEVQKKRQPIVITKHGKPVAKLVPADAEPAAGLYGSLKGRAQIVGDIVAPLDIAWNAEK